MKKISTEMALLLHSLIAQESGGSTGIRDLGLLDSALQSAFQTFDGKDLFVCPQPLPLSRMTCCPYLKHGSRSIIPSSAIPKCPEAVTLQRWNSRNSSHRMSLHL